MKKIPTINGEKIDFNQIEINGSYLIKCEKNKVSNVRHRLSTVLKGSPIKIRTVIEEKDGEVIGVRFFRLQ